MTTLRAPTGIRLSQEEHRKLKALADLYERSLAAEIRIAIREHLAMHQAYTEGWLRDKKGMEANVILDDDALPLSEDTGCPPGCLSASGQAALTEGQGNAAEVLPAQVSLPAQNLGGE